MTEAMDGWTDHTRGSRSSLELELEDTRQLLADQKEQLYDALCARDEAKASEAKAWEMAEALSRSTMRHRVGTHWRALARVLYAQHANNRDEAIEAMHEAMVDELRDLAGVLTFRGHAQDLVAAAHSASEARKGEA